MRSKFVDALTQWRIQPAKREILFLKRIVTGILSRNSRKGVLGKILEKVRVPRRP